MTAQQLLPQAIDEVGATNASRVVANFLDPPHSDVDCLSLTFGQLAAAIDRLSWWLRSHKERLGLADFDTVTYVGFPDLRYFVVLVASIKCGLTVLFSSPTNSCAAHQLLMKGAGSKLLLLTREMPLDELEREAACPCERIPSVAALLEPKSQSDKQYPYAKTFAEACNDPVVYFHSSGSTGRPKLRLWTNTHTSNTLLRHHEASSTFDGSPLFTSIQADEGPGAIRLMLGVAIFHAGMAAALLTAVFSDSYAVILPPFHVPPSHVTASLVKSWITRGRPHRLNMFPARLDLALGDPELLDLMASMRSVAYVGAPLGPELGDVLSKRTRLFPAWGSTEIAWIPSYTVDPEDWQYIKVDSAALGIEWRRPCSKGQGQGEEEDAAVVEKEMVFVRDDSLQTPPQIVFHTFPDLQEYATGDLFTPHPTKPHLWRFERRDDETIILSLSQNINPLLMEKEIARHPTVVSATLLGNNRIRPCLLLELRSDDDNVKAVDEIWPFIQDVLSTKSQYEQFGRDDIILVDPKRPLPRGMKGTVVRSQAQELYANEIYKHT